MSLLPAFIRARKRNDDAAPQIAAAADLKQADPKPAESRPNDLDDNVFDLLPPKPDETETAVAPEPEPQGRNRHPVDMTDLSRLSIDRDGRLYWDGKPVEVRRRISMSRAQVIVTSIVAAFIVIGAMASAIQGVVAARDLACQLGWSCAPAAQPRIGSDIPS
jgi:hypothetical protein